MPSRPRLLVTMATLLGISLAALEITVVGTAAPLIVRELGGFESYAWIFTIYLLAGALSMPFWGRAVDHWGRKKIFIACMVLFLVGSVLCGMAPSFTMLIIFRGLKGLGGGGLVPLAFTIIADVYNMKERTRIQGFVSSVWGVSSLVGPFIGGLLADTLGWRWIFFINLIPGGIAIALLLKYFHEEKRTTQKLELSLWSLGLSTLAITTLLIGVHLVHKQAYPVAVLLVATSVLTAALFYLSEKKSAHPLIPPRLFRHPVFNMTCLTGFLSSAFLIGLAGFVPLLFQVIHDATPTVSGLMLFPLTLSWVIFSILSTWLLLKVHYKKLILVGFFLTFAGLLIFMLLFFRLTIPVTILCTILMGAGMAFNYPVLLIITQYDCPQDLVGFATSAIFWVRNLGSSIGVGLMGITMTLYFQTGLSRLKPTEESKPLLQYLKTHLGDLLKPHTLGLIKSFAPALEILHAAIFWAFMILFIAAFLNLCCLFFFPQETRVRE